MSAAAARTVSVGLFLVLVVLPTAAAQPVDRVQVGRRGLDVTAGFPPQTYVSVAPLPGYRAVGRFDGVSRTWRGPAFRSADGVGGAATIEWRVSFLAAPSAAVAARRALDDEAWPVVEEPRARIQHRVAGARIGSIPAAALVTEAPGENDARFASVVAFPLCHGLYVAAAFSLSTPATEFGGTPSDPVRVDGVPARRWNRERALDALAQVAVQGYLPVGRVTARTEGRTIRGVVRDCRGHPMAGIGVRLLRDGATVARGRAGADGRYRIVAPGPGSYRISVPLRVTGRAN